jgi:hypothetical protein
MPILAPSTPRTFLSGGTATVDDFIALMEPTAEQLARMEPDAALPKWFGYSIAQSGYRAHFTRSIKKIRSIVSQAGSRKPVLLVFNVSLREFWLVLLLSKRCHIVSLFQWRKLGSLPVGKRFIYNSILSASKTILVYSRIQEKYVRARFPRAETRWMGLYTDTEYFRPDAQKGSRLFSEPFLLVPGNHKRDENLVREIAESMGMLTVRFSSSSEVAREYASDQSTRIKFMASPSFSEVRNLYQQAAVVLNMGDDSEWPVGITTFCEALSMNARIVTPAGHSASGYQFPDGTKPYLNVNDASKVSDWRRAARALLRADHRFPENRTPRDLAEKFCSLAEAVATWRSLQAGRPAPYSFSHNE